MTAKQFEQIHKDIISGKFQKRLEDPGVLAMNGWVVLFHEWQKISEGMPGLRKWSTIYRIAFGTINNDKRS